MRKQQVMNVTVIVRHMQLIVHNSNTQLVHYNKWHICTSLEIPGQNLPPPITSYFIVGAGKSVRLACTATESKVHYHNLESIRFQHLTLVYIRMFQEIANLISCQIKDFNSIFSAKKHLIISILVACRQLQLCMHCTVM